MSTPPPESCMPPLKVARTSSSPEPLDLPCPLVRTVSGPVTVDPESGCMEVGQLSRSDCDAVPRLEVPAPELICRSLIASGVTADSKFLYVANDGSLYHVYVVYQDAKPMQVTALLMRKAGDQLVEQEARVAFIKPYIEDNFPRFGGICVECCVFGGLKYLCFLDYAKNLPGTGDDCDVLMRAAYSVVDGVLAQAAKDAAKGKPYVDADPLVAYCRSVSRIPLETLEEMNIEGLRELHLEQSKSILAFLPAANPAIAKAVGRSVPFASLAKFKDPELALDVCAVSLARTYLCLQNFEQTALFLLTDVSKEISDCDDIWADKIAPHACPGLLDFFDPSKDAHDSVKVHEVLRIIAAPGTKRLGQANDAARHHVGSAVVDLIEYKYFTTPAQPFDLAVPSAAEKELARLGWYGWFDEHVAKTRTYMSDRIFSPAVADDQLIALYQTVMRDISMQDVMELLAKMSQEKAE